MSIIEVDDVCKEILKALGSGSKSYAEIQRAIGAGALRTVKEHVQHLEKAGLISTKKVRKGLRIAYEISITKKGEELVTKMR